MPSHVLWGMLLFGIDIDPLAVLISGVWTKAADVTAARNKAVDVLRQARKAVRLIRDREAYPRSKFSLVWMGYTVGELRRLRSRSIGTEKGEHYDIGAPEAISIIRKLNLKPRMSSRSESILARYITDMRASIREVYRVLSPGGEAIYVIGKNTIRGTYIRNATLITAIAKELGFRLKQESARLLPGNRRYLPPPAETKRSAPLDARMRREVVLTFEKHRGLA